MRLALPRLAALAVGIALVLSCDTGPDTGRFGSGLSGGPTGVGPVGAPTGADLNPPFVRIDTPFVDPVTQAPALINVGDSILVVTTFDDDRKLGSLSITGFKETGDPALGTFVRTVRYTTITAPEPPPAATQFQPGQTFTVIRRYLKPALPLDTTLGPMVIMAIGRDSAGNVDTSTVTVSMVTGPKVTITVPTNGDDVPRGINPMSVAARATHSSGVASITIRVQGEASWPTPLDATITQSYPGGTIDVTLTGLVLIPADAPIGGRITISATAVDVNSNPGAAAPVTVFVRDAGTVAPSVCFAAIVAGQAVCESIPDKLEITDGVLVKAQGDGITSVGIILRDQQGNPLLNSSGSPIINTVTFAGPPFSSNVVQSVPLNLGLIHQGQLISVVAFATDNNTPPRTGYSMPLGTSVPITVEANAFADTTLITHGRTFAPPRSNGLVGDLAVDPVLGNVFLSNTSFNLLEVWSNATKTFTANGLAVGALPWGLFVSNDPTTLLVANSGATTISRVCIDPAVCPGGAMAELLSQRIRTRNIIIFQVSFSVNTSTGKVSLTRLPDISYSDRPQYVAQSEAGRLFFSTRPTDAARPGTLRWLDPTLITADTRQIHSYGAQGAASSAFAIFNADSIRIGLSPPNSPISDTIYIFDHPRDQLGPTYIVNDSMPPAAGTKSRAAGAALHPSGIEGDVEVILGLDVGSLGLTDTTFVAASGDRRWIGFGEGNTPGTGRVMMVNDPFLPPPPAPLASAPGFFSPHMTVTDIVHNASEKVFGIAIDRTGLQMTAHGLQTYVAAVDNPFHLRLDGVYDSFDNGAGVAYHPNANSTLSANADRVLFTATSSGIIEVVDVAHYNNRGRLTTKNDLYGPLRATLPLPQDNAGLTCPGDVNCIILKLYALSPAGLVVIDLRASDIKPGP